jgi:hypothetical protein
MPDLGHSGGRIRSAEEEVRVQERLLIRGNTEARVIVALLGLLADGREFAPDELRRHASDLKAWADDVRAVAGEEAP